MVDGLLPEWATSLVDVGAITDAELKEVAASARSAKQDLVEAIERWQPLHDPEPERPDQNFQLDGKPYNYRAAETHQVLVDLDGGLLTMPDAPQRFNTWHAVTFCGFASLASIVQPAQWMRFYAARNSATLRRWTSCPPAARSPFAWP